MTRTTKPYRTDSHGFGAAAIAGFESYAFNMRGTGRTTRLLDAVKDGDLIVVGHQQVLKEYERGLAARDKSGVGILFIDLQTHVDIEGKIRQHTPRGNAKPGRVYFDEGFAEVFTRRALEHAASRLAHFEALYSSTEEHFEQHRRDQEIQSRYSYGERHVRRA